MARIFWRSSSGIDSPPTNLREYAPIRVAHLVSSNLDQWEYAIPERHGKSDDVMLSLPGRGNNFGRGKAEYPRRRFHTANRCARTAKSVRPAR